MRNFRTGERVRIKCNGRHVAGEVLLASGNGVSLMLSFDAMLEGHVGLMPVIRDDAGRYRSIVNDVEVELEGEQ
jgi:hypothetical protein